MNDPHLLPVFTPGPPSATPGNCFFCRAPADERGAISTGAFIEEEMGTVEECARCTIQKAQMLGCLTPEAADVLRQSEADAKEMARIKGAEVARERQAKEAAQDAAEDLKRELDIVRGRKNRR